MSYKFSVKEIAVYVDVNDPELTYITEADKGYFAAHDGLECEITCRRIEDDEPYYDIKFSDGTEAEVHELLLRKRPDDQPFSEWFRNTIITDLTDAPLETTMRNVARNLQKFTEAERGS